MQRGRTKAVFHYLTERPNLIVFTEDIAKDVGYTERQVGAAISYLIKQRGEPIERRGTGQFIYNPAARKPDHNGRKLFEGLAETKSGKLVLQDEDGNLFIATPVEAVL